MDRSKDQRENPGTEKATANRVSGEKMSFSEILYVLKVRKRYLIVFLVLSLIVAVFAHLSYIPTYTAVAKINVQSQQKGMVSNVVGEILIGGGESDPIVKYMSYMASGSFFLTVSEALKFSQDFFKLNLTTPAEISPSTPKFWRYFFRMTFGGGGKETKEEKDEVLAHMTMPVETVAQMLEAITRIEAKGQTIQVSTTFLDPFTSMTVANTITETFVKFMNDRDAGELMESKTFIEQRLKENTEKLKQAELNLIDFKRKNHFYSTQGVGGKELTNFNQYDVELESSKMNILQNEKLIHYYQHQLDARDQLVMRLNQGIPLEETSTVELDQLRQQVDVLKRQKALIESQGAESEQWRVKEIEASIAKIGRKLEKYAATEKSNTKLELDMDSRSIHAKINDLKASNEGIRLKMETLEKARDALLKQVQNLPQKEQDFFYLSRDVSIQFELYSTLRKKLQEMEVQMAGIKSKLKVDALAQHPAPNPRPNLFLSLFFAILVGLFLGSVAAFAHEVLDTTIKHTSDLEDCGLLLLGNVPKIEDLKTHLLGDEALRIDALICEYAPESSEAMAFKYIRAQLDARSSHPEGRGTTVTIASPSIGEGKSFIASNLAISLSKIDKTVLLIDCDLRSPALPKYFHFPSQDGLTSILTLSKSLSESLLINHLPNLDILPTGPFHSNPTELLSNERFKMLLEYLKQEYDYIILDAPPASFVVDSAILAALTDHVILVGRFRKTKRDDLVLAHQKILQIKHRQVYGILNAVEGSHEYTPYYIMPYAIIGQALNSGSGSAEDLKRQAALNQFEKAIKSFKKRA